MHKIALGRGLDYNAQVTPSKGVLLAVLEYIKFRTLLTKAVDSGNWKHQGSTIEWAAHGTCDKPVMRPYETFEPVEFITPRESRAINSQTKFRFLNITFECRKCQPCLKARAARWAARAGLETRLSSRTWFCTYTIAPEYRLRFAIEARRRFNKEDFASVTKIILTYFTKYLKRLRKRTGLRFRYLLVVEHHKDGFPHLHALIHEIGLPLTKNAIQAEWKYGFTHVKLADEKTAVYVCKYVSKQATARVRASLRYGNGLSHSEATEMEQNVNTLTHPPIKF